MRKKILINNHKVYQPFLQQIGNQPVANGVISNSEEGVTTEELDAAIAAADSRPYKVYSARITQASTDDPTVVVYENTFGAPIVWTRSGEGNYRGDLTDAFTSNDQTAFIISPRIPSNALSIDLFRRNSTNQVEIRTSADGILSSDFIEIRVYS